MITDRLTGSIRSRSIACLLAVLCLTPASLYAEADSDGGKEASAHWSRWVANQDAFPVGAWLLPDSKASTDPQTRQQYLDAGFTLLPVPADASDVVVDDSLAPVMTWDRKANASSKDILSRSVSIPGSHRSSVAFLGQELETKSFDILGVTHRKIYQHPRPEVMLPLGSLYPNWFLHFGRENMTYERYVEHYIKRAHPAALMTTHFALLGDGTDRLWFYDNLETLRRQSLDAGIGLIGQIQSVGHGQRYREPDESDIRWQVNSYIAYGAKGLWHYYYAIDAGEPADGMLTGIGWYPKGFKQAKPGPGIGKIQDGTGSSRYHTLQDINQHLHTIWPVLKDLESVAVYHDDTQLPIGTTALKDRTETPLWNLSGEGILVGVFKNTQDRQEESVYLYLVNKKHGNVSHDGGLDSTFSLEIPDSHTALMIGRDQIESEDAQGKSRYRISLPGGAGALLHIVPKANIQEAQQ